MIFSEGGYPVREIAAQDENKVCALVRDAISGARVRNIPASVVSSLRRSLGEV